MLPCNEHFKLYSETNFCMNILQQKTCSNRVALKNSQLVFNIFYAIRRFVLQFKWNDRHSFLKLVVVVMLWIFFAALIAIVLAFDFLFQYFLIHFSWTFICHGDWTKRQLYRLTIKTRHNIMRWILTRVSNNQMSEEGIKFVFSH